MCSQLENPYPTPGAHSARIRAQGPFQEEVGLHVHVQVAEEEAQGDILLAQGIVAPQGECGLRGWG